jgi:hypothetical protein
VIRALAAVALAALVAALIGLALALAGLRASIPDED